MSGLKLATWTRRFLCAAAIAVTLGTFSSAHADTLAGVTQRAIAAVKAAEAAQAKGDKAIAAAPLVIGLASAEIWAPQVTTGANYFVSQACLTFFSGSTAYTLVIMKDGTVIAASSTNFVISMAAACAIKATVGINVTSVSGSNFTWDAFIF